MNDQRWVKRIALSLNKPEKQPDWWARASVISSFFSSVVIASVGLMVTFSFQKAQLVSSQTTADAQIQIARLKNEDDKKLQESKFASDLLQHLLSDDPKHRALAIMMLRRTVPAEMYEETIGVIAAQDADPNVRLTAIKTLAKSQNSQVATVLSDISNDSSKSQSERTIAQRSSTEVALAGRLGESNILFLATSPGERAYMAGSPQSGLFTTALLQAIRSPDGKSLTPGDLFARVQVSVAQRARLLNIEQRPSYSAEGYHVEVPIFAAPAKTVALVVGVSEYSDPEMAALSGSRRDAEQMAQTLKELGITVVSVTDRDATRRGILESLSRLVNQSVPDGAFIFYYSGHGFSRNGKGYLAAYDTILSTTPRRLEEMSVSVEAVREELSLTTARRILFLDSDLSTEVPK